MTSKTRIFFFSLTVIAVLLFSAVGPSTVYADGGKPKGPPAPGGEKSHSGGSGTHHSKSLVNLRLVPSNTTVTVLDKNGNRASLASQDAADAIVLANNPIWCPANQAPTPGANYCTDTFDSIDALLTFLQTNNADPTYQQAGTIYVPKDAYSGGESSIDFNAYDLNTIKNFDLTLQGGLDSTNNTLDPSNSTTFNVPIIIGTSASPWGGSLTFNNIQIQGVTDQTGLTVFSVKDVTINDSSFNNNDTGADVNAGGNVTINNSKFNHNEKMGIAINSGGDVSIFNVEANNNGQAGANIQASGFVAAASSFFSGNQSYSSTYDGYGLKVVSTKSISLLDVAANDNYLFGASLTGSSVAIASSTATPSSTFDNNGYDNEAIGKGLEINTSGTVSLSGVEANNNQLFGADIQAKGRVSISSSFFSGNQAYAGGIYNGYGLQVVTTGAIGINKVTANDNYLFGASLTGSEESVSESFFSNNGPSGQAIGKGLIVDSGGAVALSSVEANNNQFFGANIQAKGNVSISTSFFSGNMAYTNSQYDGYGLQVVSKGNIILAEVDASNNYLYGASLTGVDVSAFDGFFDKNGSGLVDVPLGFGLEINSNGTVRMGNVEANNNQLFGVDIQAKDRVLIGDSFFNENQSYEFTSQGQIFQGYGLQVVTSGDILLDGVVANFNNLWGGSLTGLNVTVRNSQFNNNVSPSHTFIDDTGLLVDSKGNVSLVNVEAKENRLIGASIVATGDVSIVDSRFSGNRGYICLDPSCQNLVYYGYGLKVVTPGIITATGVTAIENNLFGAHLEGSEVTVENSTFSNNGTGVGNTPEGKGLEIVSSGKATLTNVNANNNQLFGANVKAVGDVTVTGSFFSGNQSYGYTWCGKTYYGYGIQVVTTTNVTMNSVTANENYLFGASVSGVNVDIADSKFNLNGTGSAQDPEGKGLEVISTGNVTLTHSEASDNQLFGANIQSYGNVTITANIFAGNQTTAVGQGYGLKVYSGGNILLNADANGVGNQVYDNSSTGAILESWSGVTVSDSSFNNNGASGLSIKTYGADVTLTNVTASGNGLDGVDIQAACFNAVNVNGGTFANNASYGIKVLNALLHLNGIQSFANNPAGNVFQGPNVCQ